MGLPTAVSKNANTIWSAWGKVFWGFDGSIGKYTAFSINPRSPDYAKRRNALNSIHTLIGKAVTNDPNKPNGSTLLLSIQQGVVYARPALWFFDWGNVKTLLSSASTSDINGDVSAILATMDSFTTTWIQPNWSKLPAQLQF